MNDVISGCDEVLACLSKLSNSYERMSKNYSSMINSLEKLNLSIELASEKLNQLSELKRTGTQKRGN